MLFLYLQVEDKSSNELSSFPTLVASDTQSDVPAYSYAPPRHVPGRFLATRIAVHDMDKAKVRRHTQETHL